jgi:hypothetical protein
VVDIRTEVHDAGVKLLPHSRSTLTTLYGQAARLFGVKDFVNHFWLTLAPTIYHPNHVSDPYAAPYHVSIRHELVHIRQQRRAGLCGWVLRYLTSQRFRWGQEREAYLVNVRAGEEPILIAATLRRAYKITYLREEEMVVWLERHR